MGSKKKVLLLACSVILFSFVNFYPGYCYSQHINKEDILLAWDNFNNYSVVVAEKMPEEFYTFTPVEGLRTFGEQMAHIASLNIFGAYYLYDEKPEVEQQMARESKAEQIADMKNSAKYMRDIIEKQSDEDFLKEENFLTGDTMTRTKIILFVMDHMAHTRGISIMYLRSKGIAPPAYGTYKIWN